MGGEEETISKDWESGEIVWVEDKCVGVEGEGGVLGMGFGKGSKIGRELGSEN